MKNTHWMWVAIATLATALLVTIVLLLSGGGESEPVSGNGHTRAEFNALMTEGWGDTPVITIIDLCDSLDTRPDLFLIAANAAWEDPLEREWAMEFYESQCILWNN